jgi:hypothetical protein
VSFVAVGAFRPGNRCQQPADYAISGKKYQDIRVLIAPGNPVGIT